MKEPSTAQALSKIKKELNKSAGERTDLKVKIGSRVLPKSSKEVFRGPNWMDDEAESNCLHQHRLAGSMRRGGGRR
jgi:hypothetical protein